jgi:phage head maturation protease
VTDMERRFTPGQVEVRAADAEKRTIGGYAAKFNKLSPEPRRVRRADRAGCVQPRPRQRLAGRAGPVQPRRQHAARHDHGAHSAAVGGRHGPRVRRGPAAGRADVYELVQRGDVAKSSFAFRVIGEDGEEWGLTDQNFPQRTLLSVDLHDVAPVNAPAYLDTSSALRSLAKHKDADVERSAVSPLRASCASSSCGRTASPPRSATTSAPPPAWLCSAARPTGRPSHN